MLDAMQAAQETESQLVNTKRDLNEKSFNVFEFQMSQARTRDLEDQLDRRN